MTIINNEIKEAERRLSENELGNKPSETLSLIARYYKQVHKYNDASIIEILNDFLKRNCEIYNEVKWRDSIRRYVKQSKKYQLVVVDSVSLSQKEIDIINSLKAVRMRRLLFTIVCLAKFYTARNATSKDWLSTDYADLFRMAHMETTAKQQAEMLSKLYKLGYISFGKKITNLSIHVDIIDDGEPVWIIDNFKDLGYEYMIRTQPKHFERCEICGKPYKIHSNRQKYCSGCYEKIHLQQRIEWMSVARSKNRC